MGSTSYSPKSRPGKTAGYKAPKSASSVCSDKENNAKIKRNKIRRSGKMNEYGVKKYPDYTDMAYKEAVSKLRYFLNGNYAPSLRSYGGSASIKNLDESDAETAIDTKKSYPISVYGTLADYRTKVRPLMSRYLNTYADPFKHYGSLTTSKMAGATVSPSAARPPAAFSTSNPDMMTFVHKQEEYIEQLERESNYCRDELNNVLVKVKEVISENEHLQEAQKDKAVSHLLSYRRAGSDSDEDDVVDSTGLDSDNKVSPRKYRQTYGSGSGLHGPNIVFESRISELEAKLMQASIDLKKVQEENSENQRKLSEGIMDSSCFDSFKRQIENLQREKGSLEFQVKKLQSSLEQQKNCGVDVLNKIKSGNENLEQQLRDERNSLEIELRRVKDELSNERGRLRCVTGEGARRALQERDMAQRRYTQHLDDMSHELAAQYDAVSKLQSELERLRRDESDLKRELSMKTAALEDLRMDFKNKTASVQGSASMARAEKASLEEELSRARLALERAQRQANHDTNRLNEEISSLRSRLDRADADLVHARRENLRLAEQIANTEKLTMNNFRPESPTKDKDKKLTEMLQSMENKHAHTVGELEAMIVSQNSLMDKLTGECRTLTYKLDDASRRHKLEMATLQRKVDSLSESIHPAQPANTSHIQDDNRVFEPSGSFEKPGANTTELSELTSVHGNSYDSPQYDGNLGNYEKTLMERTSEEIPQQSSEKPSASKPPDELHNEITSPNTIDTAEQEYDTQDRDYETQGQDSETRDYDAQGQEGENVNTNITLGQEYDTQGDSYDTQGQDYETQKQGYDTQGQEYETQQQVYDAQGQGYDAHGQSYDTQGQIYDTEGQDFHTQGQSYDIEGKAYDSQGPIYDPISQNYDSQKQEYATEGQGFDTQSQVLDTQGDETQEQIYDTDGQGYDTQVHDLETQGRTYDAQGQDYATEGQGHDTQLQGIDHTNQEYTEGLDYQTEQTYGNEPNAYESETHQPIEENTYPSGIGENAYPTETYVGQDQKFIPNETYPEDQQQYLEQQYDPNAQYTGSDAQNYPTGQYEEHSEGSQGQGQPDGQYQDHSTDFSKRQDLEAKKAEKVDTSEANKAQPAAKARNNSPTGPPSKFIPKNKNLGLKKS